MALIFDKYKEKAIAEYYEVKSNKQLIIVGTGTLFMKIKSFYNIDVEKDVLLFTETIPTEASYLGKEIVRIDELSLKIAGNKDIVFLVCSSAWKEIKKSIPTKIRSNYTFLIPYESSKWLFNKEKYPITKLENNVRKLLVNYREIIPPSEKESLTLLISERNGEPQPYHSIVLGVLLRLQGLRVHFLYNDLSNNGELGQGKGFNEYQNKVFENLLADVSEKYNIDVERMSEQEPTDINSKEKNQLEQFIYYNKVWHSKKAIFNDVDKKSLDTREKRWYSNAKLIKGYLMKHNFDKAYVWTGIHDEWSAFRIFADELNIKTYASEYVRGGYSFSLSGPTVFQKDSTLINREQLNYRQLDKIYDYSNKHLEEKLTGTKIFDDPQPYVVIPLNILWDSAAFSMEDIFIYFDEWLIKTITFLIEECKIKVYVRQHPYEREYNTGKEVESLLNERFGNSDLFTFIDAFSDVDTYALVQSAEFILPNTSTIGLEAAMMGKHVIMKNEVYYANLGFVDKANTEEEYFKMIKSALIKPKKLSEKQIDDAKYYFAMTMMNSTNQFFGHWTKEVEHWSNLMLSEVLKHYSVKWMIDLIINDRALLKNKLLL